LDARKAGRVSWRALAETGEGFTAYPVVKGTCFKVVKESVVAEGNALQPQWMNSKRRSWAFEKATAVNIYVMIESATKASY
jgi:hypothetical protein